MPFEGHTLPIHKTQKCGMICVYIQHVHLYLHIHIVSIPIIVLIYHIATCVCVCVHYLWIVWFVCNWQCLYISTGTSTVFSYTLVDTLFNCCSHETLRGFLDFSFIFAQHLHEETSKQGLRLEQWQFWYHKKMSQFWLSVTLIFTTLVNHPQILVSNERKTTCWFSLCIVVSKHHA